VKGQRFKSIARSVLKYLIEGLAWMGAGYVWNGCQCGRWNECQCREQDEHSRESQN
jgi:hypothetical protein